MTRGFVKTDGRKKEFKDLPSQGKSGRQTERENVCFSILSIFIFFNSVDKKAGQEGLSMAMVG